MRPTRGEAGSGTIVETVRHIRTIVKEMRQLTVLGKEELVAEAKKLQAPLEIVEWVAEHGRLPVPNFSAGGIPTPANASLVMQLGADTVFVGSEIFKSSDPAPRGRRRLCRRRRTSAIRRSCWRRASNWRCDAGPGD
jgi:pyridoxal 5'-phosphate synthase pdxS subunit